MESAALEAYRKDVENNADLSSIAINNTARQNNSKKLWNETKNEHGKSYYLNVVTNGTNKYILIYLFNR